ncbi:Insulin-induced gene protein [Podarcis lilfordi]|uniref:Insulin-induced gene protein n=1 Tax=Podarcis lilfordi TaxID=74358 RepID=A0AA35JN18_9SAUR|nr:Insulin-induced gene protein [Podarcis lilfordi]
MADDDDTQPSIPKKCGPYISSVTSHSLNLMIRGIVLFLIGVFLALVLNLLQIQRNVTLFPPDVITSVFSSAWWVPLCCGTASAVIGLLYPCMDRHLGEPHKFKREWSSVMRCVAVFVGINHASAVSFSMVMKLAAASKLFSRRPRAKQQLPRSLHRDCTPGALPDVAANLLVALPLLTQGDLQQFQATCLK